MDAYLARPPIQLPPEPQKFSTTLKPLVVGIKEDAFWSSSQQSESVWFQIFGSKDLLTTLPLRYLTKTKHVAVAVR